MSKDICFEQIESEIEDDYSDDSLFNISSWGADLSFREIITMYEENELIKPELQRKYVWDKTEASRFIDSLLIGLPVPSVFFAKSGSQKLIVDGYQRIMTVYDYVHGIFSGDGSVFKLSNTEKINKRWRNLTFNQLTIDQQRKIKSTTIHAIIFEQKEPENDDTSMYQIFERINTSGKTLTSQEIRNCVYQGSLNTLLFELNDDANWRLLYGSSAPDSRMRDVECILRFFVMNSDIVQKSEATQISLKKVLNDYMNTNRNAEISELEKYKVAFCETMKKIVNSIGVKAFRNYVNGKYSRKFNPTLYDAIAAAFYRINKGSLPSLVDKHKELFDNKEFIDACRQHTTTIENIKKRMSIAERVLFEGINDDGKCSD